MKKRFNEESKNLIISLTTAGVLIILAYMTLSHIPLIKKWFNVLLNALLPFILGFAIQFTLAPLMFRMEQFLCDKCKFGKKMARMLSTMLSVAFLIVLIVAFFSMLIPQLRDTFILLGNSMSTYYPKVSNWINGFSNSDIEWVRELANQFSGPINSALQSMTKIITDFIPNGVGTTIQTATTIGTFVWNFAIGMIVAVYLLLDYENIHYHSKLLLYALLEKEAADHVSRVSYITSDMFKKFIVGKGMDSLVIGILCLIGLSILRIPYALLIACVVGVTNMIPFFGPFIGAIPSMLLLVIIKPIYVVEFAVFILILQQLDGNIIGPAILGDKMGLPSIWIMFAVMVGGSLFGVLGMFLGVPVFAVIYTLSKEAVMKCLRNKEVEL